LGRGTVQRLGFGGESVLGELEGVGAEGVGLQNLGAGGHVLAVNVPHQVGLPHGEFIEADVQEDAPVVELGPHAAVEDVDPAVVEKFAESGHQADTSVGVRPGVYAR
jgi:hypothetical protein